MCGLKALRIALDLRHVPSLVRHVRGEPLPDGVPLLLRIAASDAEAEQQALGLVDRSLAEIREAAAFFIEQILFAPEADSYRVLGAAPEASSAELRRNMALLMRWLHPDADGQGDRRVFAGRVAGAWDDVKTSERRAAYDSRMGTAQGSAPSGRAKSPKRSAGKRTWSGARRHSSSHAGGRTLMPYGRERTGLLARVLSLISGIRRHLNRSHTVTDRDRTS